MKITTVLGARPQFIKAAVLSAALQRVGGVKEVVIHTGQHYDDNMSAVFFRDLGMFEPNYNLGIGGGSHAQQTGRQLAAIEEVLLAEKPDCVLVYGDTNSTLAGALAAAKLNMPVAHVEAGLRSFNRSMPEEINRILTDHCSDFLFAPTELAMRNLEREGLTASKTFLVGDVMYDAALRFGEQARINTDVLSRLGIQPKGYILATLHRAANTDSTDCLKAIMEGLAIVSEEIPVVFPVHPRTRVALARAQIKLPEADGRLELITPVGYLEMLALEQSAAVITTDSGGVQKEAFFFRVPCVTLRHETEWQELVDAGWNRLCPPISNLMISKAILGAIECQGAPLDAYGNGHAAERIRVILQQHLQKL